MYKRLVTLVFIILYIALELSVIRWGIPGQERVFLYHMDEWHQMMSIRALVHEGTPNVSGAANGPILQFVISGIWAAPAILTKYVDLDSITSPISGLVAQERLFIILRMNTIFFGLLTIYALRIILKKYLLVSRWFIGFFIFAPVWLFLSNYFKYDIALTFWITASILALLEYGRKKTLSSYLLAAVPVAAAISTKISAVPILLLYIFAYFLYHRSWREQLSQLTYGCTAVLILFCLLGIPDLILFAKGDYLLYLYDNIVTVPSRTANFVLPMQFWWYLALRQFPITFGYGFSLLLLGFAFLNIYYRKKFKTTISLDERLLWFGMVVFVCSVLPLKIYLVGNRALVLFPFLFLLLSLLIKRIFATVTDTTSKQLLYVIIFIGLSMQLFQGISSFAVHWGTDVRAVSSRWIAENIPQGSQIGIENIAVYQFLPDSVLTEYYSGQYLPEQSQLREYQTVEPQATTLPEYIFISNVIATQYEHVSPKKELLNRMQQENYQPIAQFRPDLTWFSVFGSTQDIYLSGLAAIPTDITIYAKQ